MEVLYSRCGGIDVHERFVVVCFSQGEQGQRTKELRRFGTMTGDLLRLRQWLLQAGCTHVAMESTGMYWRPVYDRLYGYFELIVTNAQHMKAVPRPGKPMSRMPNGLLTSCNMVCSGAVSCRLLSSKLYGI